MAAAAALVSASAKRVLGKTLSASEDADAAPALRKERLVVLDDGIVTTSGTFGGNINRETLRKHVRRRESNAFGQGL